MDHVILLSDVSAVKFDGDWEVGLTSVSMPDQGLDLKELLDPDKDTNVCYQTGTEASMAIWSITCSLSRNLG